ncbi:MAG TPA: UPF0175 family protein [Candidatus Thermoplasmatota archaeon]|nr:UPF0175 family protein [Candidatus Thermoplasmatota archaeon]
MSGGVVLEGLDLLQRYLLALLAANNGAHIPAKLWLQKELFLLSLLRPNLARQADFVPYLQGPYSDAADTALADLRALGLADFDEFGVNIVLSARGKTVSRQVESTIPAEVKSEIDETKAFLNDLSEDELLVFTYFSYPDMVTSSVVKDRVEKVRVPRALAMYRRGKVSLEKAAELAGLSIVELKKRAGGVSDRA